MYLWNGMISKNSWNRFPAIDFKDIFGYNSYAKELGSECRKDTWRDDRVAYGVALEKL